MKQNKKLSALSAALLSCCLLGSAYAAGPCTTTAENTYSNGSFTLFVHNGGTAPVTLTNVGDQSGGGNNNS